MPAIAPEIDELLRGAIEQRRIIEFKYKQRTRIMEPHDYGLKEGIPKLLAYQVGGSSSGPVPNWRLIDVNSMLDVRMLSKTFPGGRSTSPGKHHKWDELFARVKPAPPEESSSDPKCMVRR